MRQQWSWLRPAWKTVLAGVLLAAAAGQTLPVSAQTPAPPNNTVTVDGQGIVTAPPDTANLRLGVTVQAATVESATTQAATAANAVIAAVKADGVADQDIQTSEYDVSPVYSNSDNSQVLTGYRVSNVLQVKVRVIANAGQVIDDAVTAGGNSAVVQGISFTIDDTTALAHQARLLAMQDAKAKADDYAAAAGLSAGRVVQITEQSAPQPVPVAAPLPAARSAAFTPVQAGTLQVQVNVTVSYLLQ